MCCAAGLVAICTAANAAKVGAVVGTTPLECFQHYSGYVFDRCSAPWEVGFQLDYSVLENSLDSYSPMSSVGLCTDRAGNGATARRSLAVSTEYQAAATCNADDACVAFAYQPYPDSTVFYTTTSCTTDCEQTQWMGAGRSLIVGASGVEPYLCYVRQSRNGGGGGEVSEAPEHVRIIIPPSEDSSSINGTVTLHGHAMLTPYGASFETTGSDYITVEHFDYEKGDGSFSVSFWMTNNECQEGKSEYLYSHMSSTRDDMWATSSINIYRWCETESQETIFRFSLIDTSMSEAMFDLPIEQIQRYLSVSRLWVHVILSVSTTGMKTWVDGHAMEDAGCSEASVGVLARCPYLYHTQWSSLDANPAFPRPSVLYEAVTGFDFGSGPIFLGLRADCSDRTQFRGEMAFVSVYGVVMTDLEAQRIFRAGDVALIDANAEPQREAPVDCENDDGFTDEQGYQCTDWNAYNQLCTEAASLGYSTHGQANLIAACPMSCNACVADAASAPSPTASPPPPSSPSRSTNQSSCMGPELFLERSSAITEACCDDDNPCVSGLPTACTASCAAILLPMQRDCADMIQNLQLQDTIDAAASECQQQPCSTPSEFSAYMHIVTTACCADPAAACISGLPTASCGAECAAVLLPMHATCGSGSALSMAQIESVLDAVRVCNIGH
eukprot:SAG22_NODE_778_length_7279_cov_3.312256_1_plen_670_part_00